MKNELDRAAMENAIRILKQSLSSEECRKVDSLTSDTQSLKKIAASLSDTDKAKISAIMQNPELLKKILSNPDNAESIKRFLGGKG